jgi:hypothetical protein
MVAPSPRAPAPAPAAPDAAAAIARGAGDSVPRTPKRARDEDGEGPNKELAAVFSELAGFELKQRNNKFQGIAYMKAAATLNPWEEKITSGRQASKLPGIGFNSKIKIEEFLASGKVELLEKYRRGEMD